MASASTMFKDEKITYSHTEVYNMRLLRKRPPKKALLISLKMLKKTIRKVEEDYESLGLMDDKLDGVEVYLVPFGVDYGWKWDGKDGWIDIPRVSITRIADLILKDKTMSLRNVMRHELAHGLADTHRALIRSKKYREHFVYPYDDEERQLYDPEVHVSEYASSNSAEDFAETVRYYVKRKGVIPKKWVGTIIHTKWEFIREMAEAISDGRSRWK